jgi:FkbM family methyltransferase
MVISSKKIKHFFKDRLSFVVIKIKNGPLKGYSWTLTSGFNFINGKFEPYKTEAFMQMYNKNDIFFDIGGHVGYFSALASVLSGEKGKIYAFEPRPSNASFFKKHMAINRFTNVQLYEAAVGAFDTQANFNTNTGTATGKLDPDGDIKVNVICIDKMVERNELPTPDFIKIDVEGGEGDVLKGCEQTIEKYKPKILLATHSDVLFKNCTAWLEAQGYQFRVLNRDGIKGDTEIIAWHNTPR